MTVIKLSFVLSILSLASFGQDWEFVRKYDVGQNITACDVGGLGKVYFGTNRGNVYSFLKDGTPETHYSSSIFQPITSIDASNSLRILVYYNSIGQFEYLERFTAQARTYYLTDFGISRAELATSGVNQTIWLLDENSLIQINPLNKSTLQVITLPDSLALDDKTYLTFDLNRPIISDSEQGVFYFTNDLNHYNEIRSKAVKSVNNYNNQLVFLSNETVIFWNPKTGRKEEKKAPGQGFERLAISDGNYHFTNGSQVFVYKIK